MDIISALISSIVGGLLVAIANHLFTRKKTEAEIEKIKAETKKILAEAEKINSDAKHVVSEAGYKASAGVNEKVIYDGTKGISYPDIKSEFASLYNIQKGVLVITNKDWDKYELQEYTYDGKEHPYIPKDETISGLRQFHVRCEVKVIKASYTIAAFLWETPEPDDREASIDDREVNVTDGEWKETHFYFKAPPGKNYTVNIRAERTSGNGSLQIKNLVVTERVR